MAPDSAAIMGHMSQPLSGTHEVYIYGHAFEYAYPAWISVYVDDNYSPPWTCIFNQYIYDTSPTLIHVGTTTCDWEWIGIAISIGECPGAFMIDCVIVT